MKFVTQVSGLSLGELKAIARNSMQCTVSDIDFFQTLSAHRCFLVPPWVMRAQPNGGLAKMTRVVYDSNGNLDKVQILLLVAKEFRLASHRRNTFGGRFSL
jgi:hypothetical protein